MQPFFTMVVFSIFFGRLAKLPSDGVPYPVFAYCALLPWQLFAFALTESSNSVVAQPAADHEGLLPAADHAAGGGRRRAGRFRVSFRRAAGADGVLRHRADHRALTVPLWALLAVATALGVGLWLSALNVRYRDIRYTVPFLTQIWLFATPVAYPTLARARDVAAAVRAESDGRRRGRIPLGAARHRRRRRLTVLVSLAAVGRAARRADCSTSGGPNARSPTSSDMHGRCAIRRGRPGQAATGSAEREAYGALRDSLVRVAAAPFGRSDAGRREAASRGRWILGARRRLVRDRKARSSASSAATARARARCSRSCRASPSRRQGRPRCAAASDRCSRSAPASIPS